MSGLGKAAIIGLAGAVAVAARRPKAPANRVSETTYVDVAPIFYRRCANCHRPGGIGPFSVLDYDSAAAYADEIRGKVADGVMPPWHADAPAGVFRNDRRLSPTEKELILRWIDQGAKPGDLSRLPPKPELPEKWSIVPDAVITMQRGYEVPAAGTVDYQWFQIPTNFGEDKWIQSIEILPGVHDVVHHVLVYARPPATAPGAGTAPALASSNAQPLIIRNSEHAAPPDPPSDSVNRRPAQTGTLIGTYAPGMSVVEFPPGTALRLRAGSILSLSMHYTTHGHAMTDRTSIGFRFAAGPPTEEIFASSFVNGSFSIPAGAKDFGVPAAIGVSRAVRIWGLLPHTHLRGVRWRYTLRRPDGSSEVVLDVPHYDFNWQTYYQFATPLELPGGSRLESMAWYDNSASNTHNPDPSKEVHWGQQTWEEMQYTGFLYSIVRQ
jgi:hypothetical protein